MKWITTRAGELDSSSPFLSGMLWSRGVTVCPKRGSQEADSVPGGRLMKKIMVVDDEENIRFLYKEELEEEGFVVELAKNGEEALSKIFEYYPDLIICDMMMPKMNGYELIGRLKENARTRDIPVIILTAFKTAYDKIKSILPGDVPVVEKTGGFERIIHLVRKLI